MAIPILTNLDLNKNQLLNLLLHILAAAPGSPAEGQLYYNSTNKTIEYRTNSAWVTLGRLDQISPPTNAVSLNSQKITNLADGTAASDAATFGQLQALVNGLDYKGSVRVATTGNITLSGTQTIDGVALSVGDRVLVKNQSTASQNGIYVVASGAWSRAADADSDAEVTPGMWVTVEQGTVNGDTAFMLTTNAPITVGTTSLTFAAVTGTPHDPVTLHANVDAFMGLSNQQLTMDSLAANLVLASPNGSSGVMSPRALMAADIPDLAYMKRYAANIPNNANPVINHALGTRDVTVTVYRNSTPWDTVLCDVERTDTNNVTLRFATAPSANEYRVVIVG